jgi:hypothetical protein
MSSGARHRKPRRRNQLGNHAPKGGDWGVDRGVRRMRPSDREAMVLSTRADTARA